MTNPSWSISNNQIVQVANGDHITQILIVPDGPSALGPPAGLLDLTFRPLPVLPASGGPDPLGREALIEAATHALSAGRSVQFYGGAGVGRTAIAEAVTRRLGALGVPGVQVRPKDGPHTLESIQRRLAWLLFNVSLTDTDESVLRDALARVELRALIMIVDCDLPPADLDRLRGLFPDCAFLITSARHSLFANAVGYEVDPLTRAQSRELVFARAGEVAVTLTDEQVEEAYRLTGGLPGRLLVLAAFLQRTADRPGTSMFTWIPLEEQARVLISGLGPAARHVLAAMSAYGPAVSPALFGPISGQLDPVGIESELRDAGLVTVRDDCCELTSDAALALAQGPAGVPEIDPRVAAAGLLALLTGPDGASAVDPGLLLAVARRQDLSDPEGEASRFLRAAAPHALAAGEWAIWARLLGLGVLAATNSRRPLDLVYFLTEQRTAAQLTGDLITAGAILAELENLLTGHHLGPVAGQGTEVTHSGPASVRPRPPRPKRAVRHVRRALGAGHGAGAAGAVVVVAVASLVVVKPAHGHGHHAPADGTASSQTIRAAEPAALIAWRISLKAAPNAVAEPKSTRSLVDAQYPQITGGVADRTRLRQLNLLIQQPLTSWAATIAAGEAGNSKSDPAYRNIARPVATEKTTVTAVGATVSFVYTWATGDDFGGDDATHLVLRTDTGAVIPQASLLLPAAHAEAGLRRISKAINKRTPGPELDGCGRLTASQLPTVLAGADAGLTLTRKGVVFDLTPGAQDCGVPRTTIPYAELDGLLSPQVLALIAEKPAPTTS